MDPLFHFSWTTEILSLCVFSIEKKFLLLKESEKEGRKGGRKEGGQGNLSG